MSDTHGTRGRSLERAVKLLFKSYEMYGIHCQQNFPETLSDGTRVHSHGFDFQIFNRGKFYAFDTKECNAPRWSLSLAKPHQLLALYVIEQNGGEGFFLVYFAKVKKLVKFHAGMVRQAIADGEKSLGPDDGEGTSLDILNVRGKENEKRDN